MAAPIRPSLGDWFCFPQSVVRIDRKAPTTKEHRWIVASYLPNGLEFPVVLRSTKPGFGGTRHSAHRGRCDVPESACRIDEVGWIRHETTAEVRGSEFTRGRWSCHEPDEEVHELVIDILEELHRARAQRYRRRRRRR